jgi:hypothetical protein
MIFQMKGSVPNRDKRDKLLPAAIMKHFAVRPHVGSVGLASVGSRASQFLPYRL